MAKKKKEAENREAEPETVQQPETEAPETETVQEPLEETPVQDEKPDIALELARKCDEYLAMAQRAQADFENYKRRNESARAQAYNDGVSDAVAAMLPVMDNLERALGSADENTDAKAILQGVELVKKQLNDVLAAKKCEAIDSERGTQFDPAVHNAIMTAPQEEGFEPGTVAATFQKGYRIGDKVIRYAMVSVFEQ